MERLAPHVRHRAVLNLIGQYLRRVAERGGMVEAHWRGLPLGSPPSPVLGVFFLGELDDALARGGWFHVRFMDGVLVLAPTIRKLRRAVRVVNEMFANLDLRKLPAETFIRARRERLRLAGVSPVPGRPALGGPNRRQLRRTHDPAS